METSAIIPAGISVSDTIKFVVLVGPSGSGKSTTIDELLPLRPVFNKVVSSTTRHSRPRRKGSPELEQPGVDYNFYTRRAFEDRVSGGHFVEWDECIGHLYGVEFMSVEIASQGGRIPLKDVTFYGAQNILDRFPNAKLIYLEPERPQDFGQLEREIRQRDPNVKEEEVQGRLLRAREENKQGPSLCHHVIKSVHGRISDLMIPQILEILDPYLALPVAA